MAYLRCNHQKPKNFRLGPTSYPGPYLHGPNQPKTESTVIILNSQRHFIIIIIMVMTARTSRACGTLTLTLTVSCFLSNVKSHNTW